jgi:hypothetical protein
LNVFAKALSPRAHTQGTLNKADAAMRTEMCSVGERNSQLALHSRYEHALKR